MSEQQKKMLLTISFLLLCPYSMLGATVVKLERTRCMGDCPSYHLTVYGEGTVIYEGYGSVEVTGLQITRIPRNKVNELISEINKADFFALDAEYRSAVTDLSTITVSLRLGLWAKTVVRYGNAPYALICLERKIDEVANSEQWVGRYSSVHEKRPRCNS